jgi:hypothetical protein
MGEDGMFYKESDDVWTATNYMPVAYVVYYNSAEATVDVNGKKYHGLAVGTYHDNETFKGKNWSDACNWIGYSHSLLYNVTIDKLGYSRWFVPTKDHWKMAIEQGFGFNFNQDNAVPENVKGEKVLAIKNFFSNNSLPFSVLDGSYWTATETDNDNAYIIDLNSDQPIKFRTVKKSTTEVDGKKMRIRPMIAF